MNTSKQIVAIINERLKSIEVKPSKRVSDNGEMLAPGQLWTPAIDSSETLTWLFLLLEDLNGELYNAVPVFRWTERAGPYDLFVPGELVDNTLIASLELETTVSRTALKSCQQRFSPEALQYVLDARAVMMEEQRHNFFWGRDYYENNSLHLEYHEEINEQLQWLQGDVIDQVYGKHNEHTIKISQAVDSSKAVILPWPKKIKEENILALAAKDSDYDNKNISMFLIGDTDLVLEIAAHSNHKDCVISVYNKQGNPSDQQMIGYAIVNTDCSKQHSMTGKPSVCPLEIIEDKFSLIDPSGNGIELKVQT